MAHILGLLSLCELHFWTIPHKIAVDFSVHVPIPRVGLRSETHTERTTMYHTPEVAAATVAILSLALFMVDIYRKRADKAHASLLRRMRG